MTASFPTHCSPFQLRTHRTKPAGSPYQPQGRPSSSSLTPASMGTPEPPCHYDVSHSTACPRGLCHTQVSWDPQLGAL